jgi:hypothetical protein
MPVDVPKKKLTLGDVIVAAGEAFLYSSGLPWFQQKVLHRIATCRTGELGWTRYDCPDDCDYTGAVPRPCHDRNCPTCGGGRGVDWIRAREAELVDSSYFHNVFTLPSELRSLFLENRKLLFDLEMAAVRETLLEFARDPRYLGATPWLLQVQHTNNRQLGFHPHVHAIISAGGYDEVHDRWVPAKHDRYLFPVDKLSIVFRAKVIRGLKALWAKGSLSLSSADNPPLQDPTEWKRFIKALYKVRWHVFIEETFGGPEALIRYLGRYTHKTAISNAQLKSLSKDGLLTYAYKERSSGIERLRTLPAHEFLRNFCRHLLPYRFHRNRRGGLLARTKATLLRRAQELARRSSLVHKTLKPLPERPPLLCPDCGSPLRRAASLVFRAHYDRFPDPLAQAPPKHWFLKEVA